MTHRRIDGAFGDAGRVGPRGSPARNPGDAPGRTAGTGGRRLRRSVPAVALLLGALLGGCGSSPPIRYHALSPVPVAEGTRVAYDGPVLEVGSVQVPPSLSRSELVRETAAGRFEIREFDLWAAPLPRLSRQALAEDLAARLPAGKLVYPGASWPTPGAVLEVDVLSFRVSDGTATMTTSWSLRPRPAPGATGRAPGLRGAQLQLQAPVGEGGTEATTAAWSTLLGLLADRIVGDLAGGASCP